MLEDLLHAGRSLDGSKTWFQKETFVLLLAPESSEIKLGREGQEMILGRSVRREGQMLESAWVTHLSTLGYRWHVREESCMGY